MVKENINDILKGFQREACPEPECQRGYELFVVRGWDYPALMETYAAPAEIAREYHIPALVHVTEVPSRRDIRHREATNDINPTSV